MTAAYRFHFTPEQIETWIHDANRSLSQKEDFSWRSIADFMQALRTSAQKASQDHLSEALASITKQLADEAGEPESGPWTSTFHYTLEQIDRWVQEMADGPLANQGISWHSLAYFMERSDLRTFGPEISRETSRWRLLFYAFAQPFRRLANEQDVISEARVDASLAHVLAHCRAGRCAHERETQTVTLVFDTCTELWASYQADGFVPNPLPERMELMNDLGGPVLPMLNWSLRQMGRRPPPATK